MTKEQREAQRWAERHQAVVDKEVNYRAQRDLAIWRAYRSGTGPTQLAELTGLSRQQVHLIVRQQRPIVVA